MTNTYVPIELSSTPSIVDSATSTAITIASNGDVGIGTTSPDNALEVSSAVGTGTSLFKLRNSSIAATNNISQIDFEFDNSFSGTNVDVQIGAIKTNSGNEESAFFVKTTSGTGTPTERMRIDFSGNVGIGTSSPVQKLQVVSNMSITNTGGAQYLLMGNQDSTGTNNPKMLRSANGTLSIGNGNSWSSATGGTMTDHVHFNNSGNVGIGIDPSTTYKFQIYSNNERMNIGDGASIGITIGQWDTVTNRFEFAGRSTKFVQYGASDSIKFCTNGDNERLYISAGGDLVFKQDRLAIFELNSGNSVGLLLGAAAGGQQDSNYCAIGPTNGNIHYDVREGGGYSNYFNWYGGTGGTAVIAGNGSSGYGSMQASAFTVSSDYRVKTDITPLESSWVRIKQLNPIRFRYLPESLMPTENIVDGFLAHELQEIVPEAVIGEKDAVDEEGNDKHQTLDIGKLVPLLAAGLKDAIIELEELKVKYHALQEAATKIEAMQEVISQLDSRIQALEE